LLNLYDILKNYLSVSLFRQKNLLEFILKIGSYDQRGSSSDISLAGYLFVVYKDALPF